MLFLTKKVKGEARTPNQAKYIITQYSYMRTPCLRIKWPHLLSAHPPTPPTLAKNITKNAKKASTSKCRTYAKNALLNIRFADDVFNRREREYTEADVARALFAMENGTSMRKAALDHNVPYSTIKDRKKGTLPATVAFESFQKLSQTQEKHLASWIIVQGAIGRPPTHAQVRAIAASMADPTGEVKTIGKHWLDAFLRRNPSIKVLRTKSIDAKRVNGASTDVISTWFHRLLIPDVRVILLQNRWNMDETRFSSGEGDVNYMLGTGKKSKVRSKYVGQRTWTLTVECYRLPLSSLDYF